MVSLLPDVLFSVRRQRQRQNTIRRLIRQSVINEEFAIHSRLDERIIQLEAHSPTPPSNHQVEFHKISLGHTFLTAGLERYERVASSFGIEARHPLLDVRLVEFCLGLPWQLKTQRGWTKYILRRAMEPYLPAEVVWRRDKDSLMWEVNRLVLKERAEYFYQATCDEEPSLKPYVDMKKLNGYWQDYLSRGDESHAMQLWAGLALAFWLRRHRRMVRNLQQEL